MIWAAKSEELRCMRTDISRLLCRRHRSRIPTATQRRRQRRPPNTEGSTIASTFGSPLPEEMPTSPPSVRLGARGGDATEGGEAEGGCCGGEGSGGGGEGVGGGGSSAIPSLPPPHAQQTSAGSISIHRSAEQLAGEASK